MRITQIIALGAAASTVHATISAQQTVTNINIITGMSHNLDETAKSINLINAFTTGPAVINGFHSIIKVASDDYTAMTSNSKKREIGFETKKFVGGHAARAVLETRQSATYTPVEQQDICNAFITFVKVHQALLATVIGKHGILELIGVSYQMAAVLRGVEGVVDELAFFLIAEVPTCAPEATTQKKALDQSLSKSIATYADGLP